MSNCTPGPWVTGVSPCGEIADSLAVLGPNGDIVCDFGDYPDIQQRANAALIAKAPQMHDLLAHTVQQWGSYVDELDDDHEEGDMAEWLRDFVAGARGVIDG